MLGDSGVIHTWREEHGEAKFGGGLHVDLVDPDAVFGEDLQLWARFLQHLAGDHVIAADVAIDVAHQRVAITTCAQALVVAQALTEAGYEARAMTL